MDTAVKRELAALAAAAKARGAGVEFDSRRVRPGSVFVAVPGVRDDGARHIPDAVARGAAAVVAQHGAAVPAPARAMTVPNARLALAFLAGEYYGSPSARMRVFAVTGTNGKTTTAGLVRDIERAAGRECGLISTVEYSWPGHCEESSRTTPDPVSVQRQLAEMEEAGCASASMEASSHALDQERLAFVRLAAAGFTNLTQDHFDYHHGFEDYYRCKRKLFATLGELNRGAPAAINADDPYGRRLLSEAPGLGVSAVAYSTTPGAAAEVRAEGIRADAGGTSFTLCAFGAREDVRTPLIGGYNVSNILCAAAMEIAAGTDVGTVGAAVAASGPRWGRLEPFRMPSGARVFVDYAHSPDAIARALAALRDVARGRVGIVFGCGGDRDRAKRPLMARAAADGADFVIVTSDNPRSEDPEAIIDEVAKGLDGAAVPWRRIPDRREAIAAAIAEAKDGDIVLVAGKGHENYQEIAGVRHHFDDREVVGALAAVHAQAPG